MNKTACKLAARENFGVWWGGAFSVYEGWHGYYWCMALMVGMAVWCAHDFVAAFPISGEGVKSSLHPQN